MVVVEEQSETLAGSMVQSFGADFLFGFATASAQIEGAGKSSEEKSGRGPSVSFCGTQVHSSIPSCIYSVQREKCHLMRADIVCRFGISSAMRAEQLMGLMWSAHAVITSI